MAGLTDKKFVLITGASSGIGMQLAWLYAQAGYHLVIMARREDKLKDLAHDIQQKYPECEVRVFQSDAGLPQKHYEDVLRACSDLPFLAIAIANAGVGGNTHEANDVWKNAAPILNVNILGAVATLEAAKSKMITQGEGQLVGISSIAAARGMPLSSAYSASKAALAVYLESMRADLAATRINVSAIFPGFVITPMTEKNGAMPFLLSLDVAANKIFRAIQKRKKRFYFPWQMSVAYRVLYFMPDRLYDFLMRLIRNRIMVFRKDRG